jgi:acetyl-CoA synthetase (ADP-forming)
LLAPRSVAVIGASEDQSKFGGRVFRMLLKHGYDGAVYPINPNRPELFGLKTYADIAATPQPADMVVMAIPQPKVRQTIAACAASGVKGAIIITAKFSDAGPEGAAEEAEIVRIARAGNMRLIGPNCLGVISPANKVVLCSSPALDVEKLIESPIGFISQSGALMATIFDRAHGQGIGFSHCVSVGNQADLELCDFVGYLIDDDRTRVICSYVEGVKDPARLIRLADRAREKGKPWLMVKAGRTSAGAAAAYSHTASLAGSFRAMEAICREHGIVLMDDTDAMILLAASMARFPGAKVANAAIVTTSGGGGAITADRLTDKGIPLARFQAKTAARLDEVYSPGQANNPVDLGGRKEGEAVDIAAATMSAVADDETVDATLFAITTAPSVSGIAANLADAAMPGNKPFIFVLQPGKAADKARQELINRGLAFANNLDEAIRALAGWVEWSAWKKAVPATRPAGLPAVPALQPGALGEAEAKALLAAYGIPVNRGAVAANAAEAAKISAGLTYPQVLKVVSADIVHKSDVGGVVLNLTDAAGVAVAAKQMAETIAARRPGARIEGYLVQEMAASGIELIVGVNNDPQFGPIVMVGAGGVLVELIEDVALAPAPVSAETARAMLGRLKVAKLLAGIRGKGPADIEAAADVIVRVSWLAHDLHGSLRELDINPLIVRSAGEGAVAVDGRALIGTGVSQ